MAEREGPPVDQTNELEQAAREGERSIAHWRHQRDEGRVERDRLFSPDWAPDLSEHLAEYVQRWQDDPAGALCCATQGVISEQRAAELLAGEGGPWQQHEALAVGDALGPSAGFWLRLQLRHEKSA